MQAPAKSEERKRKALRRVVIEDRQRKVIEHARLSQGYAEDLDPHAHDRDTFRLINQRKDLDKLSEAAYVVPALDEWKHWTKMNDWESRNLKLEELIGKLRRREATRGEVQFLIAVCRPAWAGVAASLRRYGGIDADPGAAGIHQREGVERANELDREELDGVIQSALLEALVSCPRKFPRRFFPWLKVTLSHKALDYVRADLTEHDTLLPHDDGIRSVLDRVLGVDGHETVQALFRSRGSSGYSQWIRTMDLPALFELAEEYATYAKVGSACRRAVDRLPERQRQVVQNHYYEEMTQAEIAEANGLADSSVRNSHSGALQNLRRDDDLFQVLEAVGKVRDRARREALASTGVIAA
jgi:RNA polymerase sigma factor (sigma-70 family)